MLCCNCIYKYEMFSTLKGHRVQGGSDSDTQNILVYFDKYTVGGIQKVLRKNIGSGWQGSEAGDIGRPRNSGEDDTSAES